MKNETNFQPWSAAITVWFVVNAVNVLQSAGFLSRVASGSLAINHILGYGMIALAIPAGIALFALWQAKAGWLHRIGPLVYLAFIALMVTVEYLWQVEFRSPVRASILVPYLVLFFGSIFFMGVPMFRLNRRLWLVTVMTTILLLGSMGLAMMYGVG